MSISDVRFALKSSFASDQDGLGPSSVVSDWCSLGLCDTASLCTEFTIHTISDVRFALKGPFASDQDGLGPSSRRR